MAAGTSEMRIPADPEQRIHALRAAADRCRCIEDSDPVVVLPVCVPPLRRRGRHRVPQRSRRNGKPAEVLGKVLVGP